MHASESPIRRRRSACLIPAAGNGEGISAFRAREITIFSLNGECAIVARQSTRQEKHRECAK